MLRSALTLIAIAVAGFSQTPATPRFEVASVKPSSTEQEMGGQSGGRSGQGRLTMTNVTLKRCIMGAYAIGPNQIAGGPSWLDSDRFEILAKAEQPVGDAELMLMLQTLLAERFKLALHRETKTEVSYVLEVAGSGPKLEKAEGGESTTRNGRGLIDAKNMTMRRLAEVLSCQMDLPVVDRTGIEGAFNLKLEWTPGTNQVVKPGADTAMDSGLSVFTAIQQQLGLRLRSQKLPIEVLVIDRAERPSEN